MRRTPSRNNILTPSRTVCTQPPTHTTNIHYHLHTKSHSVYTTAHSHYKHPLSLAHQVAQCVHNRPLTLQTSTITRTPSRAVCIHPYTHYKHPLIPAHGTRQKHTQTRAETRTNAYACAQSRIHAHTYALSITHTHIHTRTYTHNTRNTRIITSV